MARSKGILIVGLIDRLKAQEDRARELLPAELHHYLRPDAVVVTSNWYPEEDFFGLLKVAGMLTPRRGAQTGYEVLAEEAAFRHLAGTYKDLLLSGELVDGLARAVKLWSFMHDSGRAENGMANDHTSFFQISNYKSIREFCLTTTGYVRGVHRAMGIEDPEVIEVKCMHSGDDCCRWEIRGKPRVD